LEFRLQAAAWIWYDASRVNAELQTNLASFATIFINRYNEIGMDDPNENPRRHQWPLPASPAR
jgi:hypothetical protein